MGKGINLRQMVFWVENCEEIKKEFNGVVKTSHNLILSFDNKSKKDDYEFIANQTMELLRKPLSRDGVKLKISSNEYGYYKTKIGKQIMIGINITKYKIPAKKDEYIRNSESQSTFDKTEWDNFTEGFNFTIGTVKEAM